jgi:hypothetical protein
MVFSADYRWNDFGLDFLTMDDTKRYTFKQALLVINGLKTISDNFLIEKHRT